MRSGNDAAAGAFDALVFLLAGTVAAGSVRASGEALFSFSSWLSSLCEQPILPCGFYLLRMLFGNDIKIVKMRSSKSISESASGSAFDVVQLTKKKKKKKQSEASGKRRHDRLLAQLGLPTSVQVSQRQREQRVLDDDSFAAVMEGVIKRDYFPPPDGQTEKKDKTEDHGGDKVVGYLDGQRLTAAETEKMIKEAVSIDDFAAKHTSEDNQSFHQLLHREHMAFLDDHQDRFSSVKKLPAAAITLDKHDDAERSACELEFWPERTINPLMFHKNEHNTGKRALPQAQGDSDEQDEEELDGGRGLMLAVTDGRSSSSTSTAGRRKKRKRKRRLSETESEEPRKRHKDKAEEQKRRRLVMRADGKSDVVEVDGPSVVPGRSRFPKGFERKLKEASLKSAARSKGKRAAVLIERKAGDGQQSVPSVNGYSLVLPLRFSVPEPTRREKVRDVMLARRTAMRGTTELGRATATPLMSSAASRSGLFSTALTSRARRDTLNTPSALYHDRMQLYHRSKKTKKK